MVRTRVLLDSRPQKQYLDEQDSSDAHGVIELKQWSEQMWLLSGSHLELDTTIQKVLQGDVLHRYKPNIYILYDNHNREPESLFTSTGYSITCQMKIQQDEYCDPTWYHHIFHHNT
jgi:hypothetical protein